MTLDDGIKAVGGIVLTALAGAVGWLWRLVLTNREDNVRQAEQLADVRRQLDEERAARLTKEDVRDVIDHALSARDKHGADRRQEYNEALTLRIKQAVLEGVSECQAQTRDEIDRLVPRIADEVAARTGRYRTGPNAG